MTFCPNCGSKDVKESNDGKTYPHPTAKGILERFIMAFCNKCLWSWNIAGAKQNEGG